MCEVKELFEEFKLREAEDATREAAEALQQARDARTAYSPRSPQPHRLRLPPLAALLAGGDGRGE